MSRGESCRRGLQDPLEGLNPAQLEAATTLDRPVLVLAGAGTGKTKLLTSRTANIIRTGKAPPRAIMNVTFTRQAAREMRERLEAMIGRDQARQVSMGTFHALSLRLLQKRPDLAGLAEGFEIADEGRAVQLLRQILEGRNDPASKNTDKLRAIAAAIGLMKDSGRLPESAKEWLDQEAATGRHAPDVLEVYEQAVDIAPAYQEALRAANLADIADLMLWPTVGMRNSDRLRRHWASQFAFLHADEYQDVNGLQAEWLALLSREALVCCVGDDSQSIYAFRGSDPSYILDFHRTWPDARVIRLVENYRSTSTILEAANHLIAHNRRRLEKNLIAGGNVQGGSSIIVREAKDLEDEADWVMSGAAEWLSDRSVQRVYVIYRSNWMSRCFEEAAIAAGLEYAIIGDTGFYDRTEIRDALAYLRFMEDPSDRDSWKRIANTPARGLGEKSLERIIAAAGSGSDLLSVAAALPDLPVRAQQGVDDLVQLRAWWGSNELSFPDAFPELLRRAGYIEHWTVSSDPKAADRLANLEELFSRVAPDCRSAEEMLNRARTAETAFKADARLQLMTVHASKGLEADAVYLVGWVEGIFPSRQSIELEDRSLDSDLEFERNLAYVALTRGRRQVSISFAPDISRNPGGPSRFIREIPAELTQWDDADTEEAYRRNRDAVS